MHGIIGLLPGRQVAAGIAAIRRRDLKIVIIIDMAGGAGHVGVAVGQQETGSAVVEFGVQPGVERVAGFAGRRKIGRGVIRVGGFLEVAQMAGGARC